MAAETTGLLCATSASRHAAIKDQCVVRAVEHLLIILYVVTATVLLVIFLLIVNLLTFADAVPYWGIFLVIWMGHLSVLVVVGSSVHLVLQSVTTDSGDTAADGDEERTTAQWHQLNERRIPLVQFLMYNLAWVLWVSLVLVVFEVLLYLALEGDVAATACLVPVYVASGLAIVSAILCRSAALSVTVTWLLLLATAILVHVTLSDPDRLHPSDAVIPSYALVAYWTLLCLYTLLLHAVDVYRLHTDQLLILVYYIVAAALFLLTIVVVDEFLGGAQVHSNGRAAPLVYRPHTHFHARARAHTVRRWEGRTRARRSRGGILCRALGRGVFFCRSGFQHPHQPGRRGGPHGGSQAHTL